MQVTREDLNPCTVKLTVVCDPQEVKDGFNKALKQFAKKAKLPGFREGKAPLHMVDAMADPQQLAEAAAENLVKESLKKAIAEVGLDQDTTVSPSVGLTAFDRNESKCEYFAKVPLKPVVELGDYSGLEVVQEGVDVTDEEVEAQIEEIRRRRSTREAVTDRGAESGDVGIVNLKREGEAGDGRNFMVTVGQMFPGLDAALTGMKVEEMKSVELEFPESFQDKTFAGSTVKVQLTLNSLNSLKLPALDEEFAKSLQVEDVSSLKNRLREALGQAKLNISREILQEQLLEKLHERSKVEVSDNMWEALANRRMEETAQEAAQQKQSLEQYAAANGMTVETLYEAWKEKAKMHVQRALLIREVFGAEKMQLNNNDLNDELLAMAQEFRMDPRELLETLQRNQALDELHFRAITRKVTDLLIAKANISAKAPDSAPAVEAPAESKPKATKRAKAEEAPEAEPKPAKKSTKKKED